MEIVLFFLYIFPTVGNIIFVVDNNKSINCVNIIYFNTNIYIKIENNYYFLK